MFKRLSITLLYLFFTFIFCGSLFAKSRCQIFYEEILAQDISSDVFTNTVQPIASLGFQKEYYFEKKIDNLEWLKDKDGYFSVGKIEKNDLIGKVNPGDKIISVNNIDLRKYKWELNSEEFFEDLFNDGEKVEVKLLNKKTNEVYIVNTVREILEVDNVYIDIYISHIKLNEKNGTFDLTLTKDFAFSGLGENFTITKIAKDKLLDGNNYEYCPFTVEQFKLLDTLDPNNGMVVGNIVKRDKSLVQEIYEFIPFEDEELSLEILFKSFETLTLRNDYDLKSFPFDKQILRIQMHQDAYYLSEYRLEESALSHRQLINYVAKDKIQGWDIVNSKIVQYPHKNPNHNEYFDGVEIVLEIERESAYYIFKIILPIILILVVCWSSIWIVPREIESKLTITIVCLLSLIAYNFVIDSELPKLEYLTTMDFIILTSYIYAAIPNFLSIYSHQRYLSKPKKERYNIEEISKRYGFLSYLSIIVIIIMINTNLSPDNTKAFLTGLLTLR